MFDEPFGLIVPPSPLNFKSSHCLLKEIVGFESKALCLLKAQTGSGAEHSEFSHIHNLVALGD